MSFIRKLLGRKNDQHGSGLSNEEVRKRVLERLFQIAPNIDALPSEEDDAVILIGEGYADVTNLAGHIRAYPDEDISEIIENFTQTFARTFDPSSDINTEEIVLVLRPKDYIDHIKSIQAEVISFHWAGDLHAIYMEDKPTAMRTLDAEILEERSQEDIFRIAIDNVRPWMDKLWSEDPASPTCLYNVTENTFLISSMVFLDEFWVHLEKNHGDEFLFAFPRKDQLFVFDLKRPDAMDIALKMIQVTWEDNFNLMSPFVFRRRDGQVEVVKAN